MAARSPHRNAQHLHRALAGTTVEMLSAQRRERGQWAQLEAADQIQVVQVKFAGNVNQKPVLVDFTVNFELAFLMKVGPGQTKLGQDRPHFNVGVEIQHPVPIHIEAQVRDWVEDGSQFITGAKCRAQAWIPAATRRYNFSALIHMSFFGLCAPTEDHTARGD